MASPFSRRGFLQAALVTGAGALIATPAPADEPAAPPPPPGPPTGDPVSFAERVPLRTTVNGAAQELTVGPDDSALDLLRERLGLTGAKRACGHGACGACTVLVDGAPWASCVLPATALEGSRVQTVEGLGPELHPVQRAFMAEDGLQCGYCTPGFVVEAVAFHDRWRAAHPGQEPTRAEVAAALSGHLCRCGAYDGIYRAVQGACAGRYDAGDPTVARVDAREKVTGKAVYTVDVRLPNQLEARILRADHAPAKVKRLDYSAAQAMPGVKAVTRLLVAGGAIRYAGQPLVALAAVDAATASAALAAIVLEVELGAAVVGLDAALAAGAPTVYADKAEGKTAPSAAEGPVMQAKWNGNLRGPVASHLLASPGKAVLALKAIEDTGQGTRVEGTWRTQTQCHTALEPHAVVASWEAGRLHLYLSTQAVDHAAQDIADRYRLARDQVRVYAPYVGGGFGAKAIITPEVLAAIDLSRLAGAPVRVVPDRAEELAVGGCRPAQQTWLALGADADGALVGMRGKAWSDSGVSVGNTGMLLARLTYQTDNKELYDYDVTTHAAPAKPFRAPGGPASAFALEGAVDELAAARGEDPLSLRRRWDPNPARQRIYRRVAELDLWTGRGPVGGDGGRYRRGVGLAAGGWPYFLDAQAQVMLIADPSGRLLAATACQDMGQGSRSVIAHSVARVLGITPAEVEVRVGDSSDPHGPMSGGSRTTTSLAPAAENAAEQLRDALVEQAGHLGYTHARPGQGGVVHDGGTVPWKDLLVHAGAQTFIGRRPRDEGGYFLPFAVQGLKVGRGLAGGVTVTEVEVDMALGRVVPRRVWAGFSVGRIQVPALANSQAHGGILQGLSYALYEERHLDPRHASLLTRGLEDYRILGIGDAPSLEIVWDEEGFEHAAAAGVGLGELVTVAAAASIANAVYHATGWRPRALPLRPDRVLQGVTA